MLVEQNHRGKLEFSTFVDYRPLVHHGNAANLGDKTKEIFSSGN